jgi:hypothetical protein
MGIGSISGKLMSGLLIFSAVASIAQKEKRGKGTYSRLLI